MEGGGQQSLGYESILAEWHLVGGSAPLDYLRARSLGLCLGCSLVRLIRCFAVSTPSTGTPFKKVCKQTRQCNPAYISIAWRKLCTLLGMTSFKNYTYSTPTDKSLTKLIASSPTHNRSRQQSIATSSVSSMLLTGNLSHRVPLFLLFSALAASPFK